MAKIRRISQFQRTFNFKSPEENLERIYAQFLKSDLGKIYQAIPWQEMVKEFNIKEVRKGPDCHFSPKGKIGLMFLKHYACCSDKKLIEQLNANTHYQFFCDILLTPDEQINNHKIISQIRCELSKNFNIKNTQKCLSSYWLPFMNELNHATTDATCYESDVRFPTDQKLLWESTEWTYNQIKLIFKHLKLKMPRTKFLKWKTRYFVYSRKRRKPSKERRVLTRSLLHLLNKLNQELNTIEQEYDFEMPYIYYKRREIIKKIYEQQSEMFSTKETVKNRIVSISKSYIRPIVRGKETKKVEFGAKVNKIQIDGINFIEHLSFNAFNEGTRFKSSVRLAQELTNTKLAVMGADAIYATNANRKFATSNIIRTDFCRKGRAGKHEAQRKQLASLIKKERASRLEGSFGKEKEHYYLKKVKARTRKNEILWIFFGIHTANALEIGRRMALEESKQVA